MPAFTTLPPRPLLRKWAFYDGPMPYTYLARFLNELGYTKTTRRHPLGRPIAAADVRRFIHEQLKTHPGYPVNRQPTVDDYDRLRVAIIAEMDEEEML